jgi:hypothetical protein
MFYADDVIFEGSMAPCSWEAGIGITGGSQPEDDSFELPQQGEPESGWSTDSTAGMVFAAHSQGDDNSWIPYTTLATAWGADLDLRTDTQSQVHQASLLKTIGGLHHRHHSRCTPQLYLDRMHQHKVMRTQPVSMAPSDSSLRYSQFQLLAICTRAVLSCVLRTLSQCIPH